MTAGGDDDPDRDPVLDSMRSVWLSMRDEEPPSAGLSQLLAAAREKAEAMQPKPVWWRRALDAFKRPPVLALATTVVLIGGAVLVANRPEKLATEPARAPVPQAPAAARPAAPTETAPNAAEPETGGMAPGGLLDETAPSKAAVPERDSNQHAAPERDANKPAAPEHNAKPSPPSAPRPRPRAGSPTPPPAPVTVTEEAPPPPPPPPPVSATKDSGRVLPGGDAEITDDKSMPKAAQSQDEGGETIAVGGQRRGPSVDQLARQAETAAARGDCPAVRAIALRLEKLDRAAYRERVSNNATVKSCLTRR